jgi:hypothetical protein
MLSSLAGGESAGEPPGSPDQQSAGETLAQLDGMSDAEIEKMLNKLTE